MLEEEVEFCRECGMEFPDGPEEKCSLCGNEIEVPEDNYMAREFEEKYGRDHCVVCGEWCSYEELDFQQFWLRFDSPPWLDMAQRWCARCIIKRIHDQYPEIEQSGLLPDTYLIWKQAKSLGIDIGPKLWEIDEAHLLFSLHDFYLTREEIIEWLSSDFPVGEIEAWLESAHSLDAALKWRDAGFGPDPETTEMWIDWGVKPKTAARYVRQGIVCPPDAGYRDFQISLKDALFFDENGFVCEDDWSGRDQIGNWIGSGLSAEQIVALRDELVEREHIFEGLHERIRWKFEDDFARNFRDFLPRQFEEMKSVGLPITATNLERYWGLSSEEILKVIDSGGKVDVAAELVRRGAPSSKVSVADRLVALGVPLSLAATIAARGLLVRHLSQIKAMGDIQSTLERLMEVLDCLEPDASIDDAFDWMDLDGPTVDVRSWVRLGFGPLEALRWSDEGFLPASAGRWRDSGVDSPSVAKHRYDAGLEPRSVVPKPATGRPQFSPKRSRKRP